MSTWLPTLITKTPEEGYELAVKLSRMAIKMTQPDPEARDRMRPAYAEDAEALISVSQVVATHFATVAAAVIALALIAFGKSWAAWGVAVILLMAPHLIGAPEPATFAGTTPPEIAGLFAARAFGVGLAAWVILGCAAGFFWRREIERVH